MEQGGVVPSPALGGGGFVAWLRYDLVEEGVAVVDERRSLVSVRIICEASVGLFVPYEERIWGRAREGVVIRGGVVDIWEYKNNSMTVISHLFITGLSFRIHDSAIQQYHMLKIL